MRVTVLRHLIGTMTPIPVTVQRMIMVRFGTKTVLEPTQLQTTRQTVVLRPCLLLTGEPIMP